VYLIENHLFAIAVLNCEQDRDDIATAVARQALVMMFTRKQYSGCCCGVDAVLFGFV
jgi:hypothetical protein